MLLKAREHMDTLCHQLDQTSGMHFKTDFAFATGANLMRGLKHPSTKTTTVRVLTTFLQIFGKEMPPSNKVHPTLLGFLAPLLPNVKPVEMRDLLWLGGETLSCVYYLLDFISIFFVLFQFLLFSSTASRISRVRKHRGRGAGEQENVYQGLQEAVPAR